MRIWVISDGIPGHFNQSQGIVMELQRSKQCQVTWIESRLRAGAMRAVLRVLLNFTKRPLPVSWLRFFFKTEKLPEELPNLIVGTGGKVSFIVAWLARSLAVDSVFCGSLRGLKSSHFTVLLCIERPKAFAPNAIVLDLPPMPVDIKSQRKAGAFLRSKADANKTIWLMLIGGNGAGYSYENQDWRRLTDEMSALSASHGVVWLISTSRRTGSKVEAILQDALSSLDLLDSVWWAEEPRAVLETFFGAADVVCCTADSMSMLAEAVASRKPVVAWRPVSSIPDERYLVALGRFVNNKRILLSDNLYQAVERLNELSPLDESADTGRRILEKLQSGRKA